MPNIANCMQGVPQQDSTIFKCEECAPGFLLHENGGNLYDVDCYSKSSKPKYQNCEYVNYRDECLRCSPGYYLLQSNCQKIQKAAPLCLKGEDESGNCIQCVYGYYLKSELIKSQCLKAVNCKVTLDG